MRVGDSLELAYKLPGPLPAGTYAVRADGYQAAGDAMFHVDLLLRAPAAPDLVIAQGDVRGAPAGGAGSPGPFELTLMARPIAARCGDPLVSRIHFLSGSSDYTDLFITMQIP